MLTPPAAGPDMSDRNGGIGVPRLLAAVARRVEQTSLRQAAREVMLSPTGLRKVLAGSKLHPSTERKLVSWYVRHLARDGDRDALDPETASAALALLTEGLPDRERRFLVDTFVAMLEDGYRRASVPVPAWVVDLRRDPPPRD